MKKVCYRYSYAVIFFSGVYFDVNFRTQICEVNAVKTTAETAGI